MMISNRITNETAIIAEVLSAGSAAAVYGAAAVDGIVDVNVTVVGKDSVVVGIGSAKTTTTRIRSVECGICPLPLLQFVLYTALKILNLKCIG